jgi:hypothetical protein
MTFYGGIFRHFLGERSEPPYIHLSKSITWNGRGVGKPLGYPKWNGRGVGKPLGYPKWNGRGVGKPLGSLIPIFYSIVYNYISNSIPIQKNIIKWN